MTYEELIEQMIGENNKIVVMTAENRSMLRNAPPRIANNFVDVGISEMTLIGMAAGLALRGRTVICHALAPFITMRAFEFARTDVGARNFPVKLIGAIPGFLSTQNGFTHQAVEDVALMSSIPNFGVFAPADNDEMIAGLKEVINSPNPFYIRFNDLPAAVSHNTPFEIGKAEQFGSGNDVAIVTYGVLLREAVKAAEILESRGVSTRVINLRTVKPMDEEAVIKAARETKLMVTLEDHFEFGGAYSMIAKLLFENKILTDIIPFNLKDKWFKPVALDEIIEFEGFRGTDIAEKVLSKLK